MIYAGIGSRETPEEILMTFEETARIFSKWGFVLRSGAADGADSAFEKGCDDVNGKKEIFIPWNGYNGRYDCHYHISKESLSIAEKFHPAWRNCSQGAQKLHARNAYIVLGEHLDNPVDFVLCWTRDNGGTTQALRIAQNKDIPFFNYIYKDDIHRLTKFLAEKISKGEIKK